MKIKVWLQPHELDLTIDCLRFAKDQLNQGLASDAHKVAGRYMFRRIVEVIAIMESAKAKADAARTLPESAESR